jgi:hypothetical protein
VVYSLGERNYNENLDAAWSVFTGPQFRSVQWLMAYYHGTKPPQRSGPSITLPGGAKVEYRSILSESRGANDADAGGRPDLIVFDDIIPTEAAWSSTMRTRIEDRILTMILPMGGPDCVIRGAGTMVHREDFVSKAARGVIAGWQTTENRDRSAKTSDGVLFPERFSAKELSQIEAEYSSLGKGYLYRREYLNDISEDATNPLAVYDVPIGTPTGNTIKVLAVDHSQGVGLDYFVAVELERDTQGRTYIGRLVRDNKLPLEGRKSAIANLVKTRRPERIVIEKTSESMTFIETLEPYLQQANIHILIDKPTAASRGEKNSFIVNWVEPMLKAGSLICKDDATRDILQAEMAAFSLTSKNNVDDLLDAIASGTRYLRSADVAKPEVLKPTGIPQLDRERAKLRAALTGKQRGALSFQ